MNITKGTRLRVYKNLTTGTWSAKAKVPHPTTGKPVWRKVWGGESIVLTSVRARISIAGAARIRARNSREVVAWIEGDFAGFQGNAQDLSPIRYNPFRRDDFHRTTGETFDSADYAVFPKDSACFFV